MAKYASKLFGQKATAYPFKSFKILILFLFSLQSYAFLLYIPNSFIAPASVKTSSNLGDYYFYNIYNSLLEPAGNGSYNSPGAAPPPPATPQPQPDYRPTHSSGNNTLLGNFSYITRPYLSSSLWSWFILGAVSLSSVGTAPGLVSLIFSHADLFLFSGGITGPGAAPLGKPRTALGIV